MINLSIHLLNTLCQQIQMIRVRIGIIGFGVSIRPAKHILTVQEYFLFIFLILEKNEDTFLFLLKVTRIIVHIH